MRKSLVVRKVLPSLFLYALLILAAIGLDSLLHRIGLYWIGRYLGIVGTVLILASFAYSLRKRKIIETGSPKALLDLHETLAWTGALIILVHAGIHFNSLLPWLAVLLMLVAVASGFVGKHLLKNAREGLKSRETRLREVGMAEEELAGKLLLDATTVEVMKRWRAVHIPITTIFWTLAGLHVLSILIFWRW